MGDPAPRWRRALVTGASAGIGAAMVPRLADIGADLVLVARDGARLEALAASVADRVEAEVLVADLADAIGVDRVAARLADPDRPVDLCVNNAGFGTQGRFADAPLDEQIGMIDVNVTALVRLSHAAAGAMRDRGQGTILNVSSIAGLAPGAGTAVYGATKAFVTSFSESLDLELSGSGVRVRAVLPGLTRTEFHERGGWSTTGPRIAWQSADEVAATALRAAAGDRPVVVSGPVSRLLAGAVKLAPRRLVRAVAARRNPPD